MRVWTSALHTRNTQLIEFSFKNSKIFIKSDTITTGNAPIDSVGQPFGAVAKFDWILCSHVESNRQTHFEWKQNNLRIEHHAVWSSSFSPLTRLGVHCHSNEYSLLRHSNDTNSTYSHHPVAYIEEYYLWNMQKKWNEEKPTECSACWSLGFSLTQLDIKSLFII